ncbi:Retrovirus-related Pol polyprotein from transposon 297 [Vitis vinifera]|uniref:Retrovirus-related Pol polyprotein from transposon 297 n=1 Tax=Vitis vinifera TaxID=29760 RepID=A0A438CJF6_VITVI|nr:Retrovirus-related Pol polyprotein from transposon 297 [Vitis vinifera]
MARKVEEFKEHDKEYPANVRKILDDFSDLWPIELPNQLPPMRDVQHAIDLIPGASLPNLPAYEMNPTEHAELKRQVDELLTKGFICENLSPCGVPALLTPRRMDHGGYMMVGLVIFSKIDLRSGYHQIRIRPGMNGRHLSKLRMDCMSDHEKHLKQVMRTLRAEKFYINLKKCTFMSPSVVFLGFVVSSKGVETDPEKIKAIVDWPVPTNIHEVANKTFEEIKSKMVNPPILRLPDFEKVFEVTCDASHVGIGAVLSQEGHPVAFFSEKLNGAKKKYSTYDLEFYAVVQAIRH